MHSEPLMHTAHDPCLSTCSHSLDARMIDLHLHVLPEIDDGSSSLEMTASMLARLAEMGVTRLVTTPHLMEPLNPDYHRLVQSTLETIRPIATGHGIDLDLGYEHVLVPGLAARLQSGEQSTLAGSSAVLVELPFVGWPQHTESSLFALRVAGYVPILAHPERYIEVQKSPELAIVAGEQGAVLQLTSGSFAGVYGKAVERSARKLLDLAIDRDVVVVLASDAHSDGQRLARVPAGIKWIGSHMSRGNTLVEWASIVVPTLLLQNTPVPPFDLWAETMSSKRSTGKKDPRGDSRPPRWRRPFG